jgi:hypothetical protein
LTLKVINEISPALDKVAFDIGEMTHVIEDAAHYLYSDIMYAFAVGGPGWKPLSKFTILTKRARGAPDPEGILKEWYNMRNSIEIRNESTTNIKEESTEITSRDTRFSVGLFADTANPMNRVTRGFLHEFGGWEDQGEWIRGQGTLPSREIMEIATRRMSKRALRGENELGKFDKEVRQITHGKAKSGRAGKKEWALKMVYIPERSFLRMPFDRMESTLNAMILQGLRKILGDSF